MLCSLATASSKSFVSIASQLLTSTTLNLTMADAKVYPFAPLGTLTPPNTSTQPDKNAVARALGAAFLSHQVQELEKSVSAKPKYDSVPQGRGGRDRRGTRGGQRPQQYQQQRGHAHGGGRLPRGDRDEPRGLGRRSDEREHSSERDDRDDKTMPNKKDADIVVIDASVLVHALGQLKVWCRNGREEVIVVPLEGMCMRSIHCSCTNICFV